MAKLDLTENHLTGSRYQWSRSVMVGNRTELTPPTQFTADEADLETYVIRAGDRLDRLAFGLLGDSRLWWVLVDLNREKLSDTLFLEAGTEIRIPLLRAVAGLA